MNFVTCKKFWEISAFSKIAAHTFEVRDFPKNFLRFSGF